MMEENREQTQIFGISLSAVSVPAENIPDYLRFPHLKAIELPAEAVLFRKFLHDSEAALNALDFICAGSLADDPLLDAIVHASLKQQMSFAESLRSVFHQIAEAGISVVSMKFDMQEILKNEETAQSLTELLHLLAPALMKESLTLLLPFRMPSPSISAGEMSLFLRRTLLPCVRCRLEIHPDEITKEPEMFRLEPLIFETSLLEFVYDADAGSHVQKELIRKILDWKTRFCDPVPVLFSPESVHGRMAFTAAQVIDETAASFLTEKINQEMQ